MLASGQETGRLQWQVSTDADVVTESRYAVPTFRVNLKLIAAAERGIAENHYVLLI